MEKDDQMVSLFVALPAKYAPLQKAHSIIRGVCLFLPFYILISASTPAGSERFCRESIVFDVAFETSIRRL